MFKYACALVIGIAIGVAAFWYFSAGQYSMRTGRNQPPGSSTGRAPMIPGLDQFSVDDIKAELERTGSIVREKARQAGASISDAAANARITATIKAKFLADPELPSFTLGVDTTDGVVTLSGKVTSVDAVSRAVRIAYDVEGVHKVFSTIQVVAQQK